MLVEGALATIVSKTTKIKSFEDYLKFYKVLPKPRNRGTKKKHEQKKYEQKQPKTKQNINKTTIQISIDWQNDEEFGLKRLQGVSITQFKRIFKIPDNFPGIYI